MQPHMFSLVLLIVHVFFVKLYFDTDLGFWDCRLVRQRRGVTLHESTHNGFLQIMHPRTFLVKIPSDAKLASLSVFRKWPVSMATIAKIGNY